MKFLLKRAGVVLALCFPFAAGVQGATISTVAAGGDQSFFIMSDGSLWAMGENFYGQLGDGTFGKEILRPEIIMSSGVTAVATAGSDSGDGHTLFTKSNGSLWVMGDNAQGDLGDGHLGMGGPIPMASPEQIVSSGVIAIGVGYISSYYRTLTITGSIGHQTFTYRVLGMGDDSDGILGDGNSSGAYITPYTINADVYAFYLGAPPVAGSFFDGYYIDLSGGLWGMGYDHSGELGDAPTGFHPSPIQILSGDVTAVAGGVYYTIYLKDDSTLWGMGDNLTGELGGTSAVVSPPAVIASNVTAMAAGDNHVLFIKSDGSLWSMGYNAYGQLGDGTTNNRSAPFQVLASNVVAVAAGIGHSLFVKSDGTLWGMGYNDRGQLGDGTFFNRHSPVRIVPAQPPHLENGGFETGDFTAWTGSGDLTSSTVTTNPSYVHSGTYGARMGTATGPGMATQTVNLPTGTNYALSFWLYCNGVTPNEFACSWAGVTLMDKTNLAAVGWTNFQFNVAAAGTNGVLQFTWRNDNSYFGLDDVTFTPMIPFGITSMSLNGSNLVLTGTNALYGLTCYTLSSTNSSLPMSAWTRVATNALTVDGNFSVTVPNTVNPAGRRFYRLQFQ